MRAEGLDPWLRRGLRLLGAGYLLNLVFAAAKLSAVGARWCGRDVDWLSTDLAPPVAAVSAILVAVGFVLPHAGQYLHDRRRVRLAHRELRPLYRLLRRERRGRAVRAAPTPELRLTRRETFIRDVLLVLGRHLDAGLGRRAYAAALGLGHPPERARALAAAVSILDAVERRAAVPGPAGPAAGTDTAGLLREIGAVSRALRCPADLAAAGARRPFRRRRSRFLSEGARCRPATAGPWPASAVPPRPWGVAVAVGSRGAPAARSRPAVAGLSPGTPVGAGPGPPPGITSREPDRGCGDDRPVRAVVMYRSVRSGPPNAQAVVRGVGRVMTRSRSPEGV